jgi:regulatory protein
MAFGQTSLKGRALRLLAQREHSRTELQRKLARHLDGQDEPEARAQLARALDELAAAGLLSDERTAASVLQHQGARYGQRRLRQVLQHKGLDGALVASTLQQAGATELERARAVWLKRFGQPATDAAERARQMRFLAGRGFDGDVIRRVVSGADDED